MKTPNQVKRELSHRGLSLAEWARRNGFKPRTVYAVIQSYRKGIYGVGHDIAVLLELKDGEVRNAK